MWKNKNIKIKIILLACVIISCLCGWYFFDFAAQAEETVDLNQYYSINLDAPTIEKGYTVTAFDNIIKLSLVPDILSEETRVDVTLLNEPLSMPWQLDKISSVIQFDFRNKDAYDNHKPYYIQFSYDQDNDNLKQVFFFDKNFNSWRPLPTKDYPGENFVRSLIHLPYARIAVFSYPNILSRGKASWYAYKPGNFAASPDFPKGSILRVTNQENGKFVDVEINDYGPDRSLHPDRVIDLEKNAFNHLASLGAGIIDVSVNPIYIEPDSQGTTLGIETQGMGVQPEITAKSAIITNENTGDIIWSKNSTSTLPLASLTKLVAIHTFLEATSSLETIVTYSEKDEEYNYEYCEKWESARLKLDDGETLTVKDLIYASLAGSANNTVETLVRVSGLSRNKFIENMNLNTLAWGASSTSFVEPTGLSPENMSSVLDYAIITKEVLKNPIIRQASTIGKYKFTTINTEKTHKIKNTNSLIQLNKYNITGSKTGYLDEAGYCLMTKIDSLNGNIIIVSFGVDTRDLSVFETEKLIKYGLRQLN